MNFRKIYKKKKLITIMLILFAGFSIFLEGAAAPSSLSQPTYNSSCTVGRRGDCNGSSCSNFSGVTTGANGWTTSSVTYSMTTKVKACYGFCNNPVYDSRTCSFSVNESNDGVNTESCLVSVSRTSNATTTNNSTCVSTIYIDSTRPTIPSVAAEAFTGTSGPLPVYSGTDSATMYYSFNDPKFFLTNMGLDTKSQIWKNNVYFDTLANGTVTTATVFKDYGSGTKNPNDAVREGSYSPAAPSPTPSPNCWTKYLRVQAVDWAGWTSITGGDNTDGWKTVFTFRYAGESPSISAALPSGSVNGWVSTASIPFTVNHPCSFATGSAYYYWDATNAFVQGGSATTTLLSDGSHPLFFKAVDNAVPTPNESSVGNATFYIDKVKPYIAVPANDFLLPNINSEPYLSTNFYSRFQLDTNSSEVMKLTFKATDDTSGVWDVRWVFDAAPIFSNVFPPNLPIPQGGDDGVVINDSAGCVITNVTKTSECNTFTTSTIDLKGINGAIGINGVAPDGDHNIQLAYRDRAGNKEDAQKNFKVDNHAPCELSGDNCKLLINSVYDNNLTGAKPTNNPMVNLILSVSDGAGSGVSSMQVISVHKGDNIKPNPQSNIGMAMGNYGQCTLASATSNHTTKSECISAGGTWNITNSFQSYAGYYNESPDVTSNTGQYFENNSLSWSSPAPSTISNFNISNLAVPLQGYYLVCARYMDNVGNITAVTNTSDDLANRYSVKVLGQSNEDTITGNVLWGGANGNTFFGSAVNYGNSDVCTYINLDTLSPAGPLDFKLFAGATQISGGASGRAPQFYDNDGSGNFTHPVISNTPIWGNVPSLDLKFKLPSNPLPGTGISKLKYYFTANFDETQLVNPLTNNVDFLEGTGLLADIQPGTCSSSSYTSQLACEDNGNIWTDYGLCNASTTQPVPNQSVCESMNGTWETAICKNSPGGTQIYLRSASSCLAASQTWVSSEITKTIVYNSTTEPDGCKNLYIWLGDEAGNFVTKDASGNNDLNYNAGIFCYDDEPPGRVGVPAEALGGQSPVSFPTDVTVPQGIIKFYDYELLKLYNGAPSNFFVEGSLIFDPEETSGIKDADKSKNVSNANIIRTRDLNGNLFTSGNEGYRLVIAWVPVDDKPDPNGGSRSGLKATSPYRLCWSKTLGDCTYFKDLDEAATTYTGSGVNKYKVSILDNSTPRCVTHVETVDFDTQTECTTAGGTWLKEMETLDSGQWYFLVETRDKALNKSVSNPIGIIIDNTYPCWTDPALGDSVTQGTQLYNTAEGFHKGKDGSVNCSITSTNHVDSIDYTSATDELKAASGLSGFLSVFRSNIIGYFKCGDPTSEKCDEENGATGGNPAKLGGVIANFILGTVDNPAGSNFDTATLVPQPYNVQFGLGLSQFSGCNREIVYWVPYDHQFLSSNHFLGDGGVDFNFHLFEKHVNAIPAPYSAGSGDCDSNVTDDNDPVGMFTYYNTNPPAWNVAAWDADTPADFSDANVNIQRIRFTQKDGREVLRNIYFRVKDIAGNWSPFDHKSNVGVMIQPVIVDTKPPERMWYASNKTSSPAIHKQSDNSFIMGVRDDDTNGIPEYYNPIGDALVNGETNIANTKFQPTNEPTFTVRIVKPIDFSTVVKGLYKLDTPPTSAVDTTGSFTPDVTGGFSIAANTNFQTVYLWLEDKLGNPDSAAVPGIDLYYQQGTECDFSSGANMYNAVGSGTCTGATGGPYTDVDSCVTNAGVWVPPKTTCRVVRFQLPYDGTKPVWQTYTETGASAPTPYLYDYTNTTTEFTNTGYPVFHYFQAIDKAASGVCSIGPMVNTTTALCASAAGTWTETEGGVCSIAPTTNITKALCDVATGNWFAKESGLRNSAIDAGKTYTLCLDTDPPPACGTAIYSDNNNPTVLVNGLSSTFSIPYQRGTCDVAATTNVTQAMCVAALGNWTPVFGGSLSAQNYYFWVKAFDRAGNESNPSPTRRILVDTAPPCTTGAPSNDTCLVTAKSASAPVDRVYSTNEPNGGIKLDFIAEDFHSGVGAFQMGEYYWTNSNGGECVMRMLSYSNGQYRMRRTTSGNMTVGMGDLDNENTGSAIATKRTAMTQADCENGTFAGHGYCVNAEYTTSGACTTAGSQWYTSSIDFGAAGGVQTVDTNTSNDTILPFSSGTALSIGFTPGVLTQGFIVTTSQDGSHAQNGRKTLEIRFRDKGGNWSAPLKEEIIYDNETPPAPKSIAVEANGTPLVWPQWTRADTITLILELPNDGLPVTADGITEDRSSDPSIGDPFGIRNIYYKIGTGGEVPLKVADANNLGGGKYSFIYNPPASGKDILTEIWLEDVLGNKAPAASANKLTALINVDKVEPNAPGTPVSQAGFKGYLPKFIWPAASDPSPGIGLFDINVHGTTVTDIFDTASYVQGTYKICWDTTAGQCTISRWVNNINEYELQVGEELTQGTWYFMVYAYDGVGRRSAAAMATPLSFVPAYPTLGYMGYDEFSKTAVAADSDTKPGQEGNYTFKILYSQGDGVEPEAKSKHVMLDLNGNGVYEASETFEMTKATGLTGIPLDIQYSDGSFFNGEMYYYKTKLPFVKETFGMLRYRFKFRALGVTATKNATTAFEPSIDHYIDVQRYNGIGVTIAEVRNNVQRPSSKKPVVLIIAPPKDPTTKISATVVNRQGKLVRKLLDSVAYSEMQRDYLYWDTTNENNRPVASGLYYLIVRVKDVQTVKKVVIVR